MLQEFQEAETSVCETGAISCHCPILNSEEPNSRKRTVEDVFGSVRGEVVFYEDVNAPTIDEWPEA